MKLSEMCAALQIGSLTSVLALSLPALLGGCSSDPAAPGGSGGASAGGMNGGLSGGGASTGGTPSTSAGATGAGASGAGTSGAPSAGASSAGASSAGASGAGTAGSASGGGTASACPADATFCSGFEVTTLPTSAVYKANAAPGDWSRDFEVDSTLFHGGKSSLRVKSGSADAGASGAYQMLAVPAPTGKFWVRFYIQQTELDIGGMDHNVFTGASPTDDPNAAMIELAEDVGVAFNTKDDVRWPMGYGRTSGNQLFTLPKGMWHCVEISFDSQTHEQQLFVNGTQQIDAAMYPTGDIGGDVKIFKFGFNKLHGPARKVWYDDVAVGPSRIHCS